MNKIYKGFVTLPRDIQLLPLWDNPHDTVLWLYCLLHASHQSYKDLQPGQFYASQKKIAEELKWSRKTVGVCLRRLEQKEMLRADTSDLGTVITVMHWDEISSGRGLCGENDNDVCSETAAYENGWQRDENKRCETDESTSLCETLFEQFWEIYPRKRDKAEARRMFMEMPLNAEYIITATQIAKSSVEWLTDGGRYIPGPTKWLDGMWEQYSPYVPVRKANEDEEEEWETR